MGYRLTTNTVHSAEENEGQAENADVSWIRFFIRNKFETALNHSDDRGVLRRLTTTVRGKITNLLQSEEVVPYYESLEFRTLLEECRRDHDQLFLPFTAVEASTVQPERDEDIGVQECINIGLDYANNGLSHMINDIESEFVNFSFRLQKAIIEQGIKSRIQLPVYWLTSIVKRDIDLAKRMIKHVKTQPDVAVSKIQECLLEAGKDSYEFSQQLLDEFPTLLQSYKKKYAWCYTSEAFKGLKVEDCMHILQNEYNLQGRNFKVSVDMDEYINNGSEELLEAVMQFLDTTNERESINDSIINGIIERKGENLDGKTRKWLEKKYENLTDYKKSCVRGVYKELEQTFEELYPKFAPFIRRLERSGFNVHQPHLHNWFQRTESDTKWSRYRDVLLAIPENASFEEIKAFMLENLIQVRSETVLGSDKPELAHSEVFLACWLAKPKLSYVEVFTNHQEIGESEVVSIIKKTPKVPYDDKLVLFKALKDPYLLAMIFSKDNQSELWQSLSEHLTKREEFEFLTKFTTILCNPHVFKQLRENLVLSSKVLTTLLQLMAEISPEKTRKQLHWISQIPEVSQSINPEDAIFTISYAPALKALEQQVTSVDNKRKTVKLPSLFILKQAIESSQKKRSVVKIPCTKPEELAVKYVKVLQEFKRKKRRLNKKQESLHNKNLTVNQRLNEARFSDSRESITMPYMQESTPSVSQLAEQPETIAMLEKQLHGNEQYLVVGYLDKCENGKYVQTPVCKTDVLDALKASLPNTEAEQHINNTIYIRSMSSDSTLAVPADAKLGECSNSDGKKRQLLRSQSGLHTVDLKGDQESIQLGFSTPIQGYPLIKEMPIDQISTHIPEQLQAFIEPDLQYEKLAPELQVVVIKAKQLPVKQAIELIETSVREFMTYDDTVDELYEYLREDDVIQSGNGSHAYLEQIMHCRKGVCSQHARLTAELLRQVGICCIETNVIWAQNTSLTTNDFHRIVMAIVLNEEGDLMQVPVEGTGANSIVELLLRHLQTDAGITSPVKRTEAVTPEDPEVPIAAGYWSFFLDSEVQIGIPKQVLFADIKAVIKLLNLPEDKTAGASIARILQCVATNDGKRNAQQLLENTTTKLTEGQKETINFCLAHSAVIENQVLERIKSEVPDLHFFRRHNTTCIAKSFYKYSCTR